MVHFANIAKFVYYNIATIAQEFGVLRRNIEFSDGTTGFFITKIKSHFLLERFIFLSKAIKSIRLENNCLGIIKKEEGLDLFPNILRVYLSVGATLRRKGDSVTNTARA